MSIWKYTSSMYSQNHIQNKTRLKSSGFKFYKKYGEIFNRGIYYKGKKENDLVLYSFLSQYNRLFSYVPYTQDIADAHVSDQTIPNLCVRIDNCNTHFHKTTSQYKKGVLLQVWLYFLLSTVLISPSNRRCYKCHRQPYR